MTHEEKKRLIEAAKMIKDFCDERCEDVECPFLREYGCGINDTENPKYWYIPEPKRWSRDDVALAKALKAVGVTEIYGSTSHYRLWKDEKMNRGYLPSLAFRNLYCMETVKIDDIIKEEER